MGLDSPVHHKAEITLRASRLTECVRGTVLPDGHTGYLRFRSCVDRAVAHPAELEYLGVPMESVPDMEEECWDFFSHLASVGVRSLILDLRENEGGNSSVGEVLLKYLTNEPVPTYGGGSIVYPYESRLDDQHLAQLPQFRGAVFVLIDSGVFSSGEWLAAQLRASNLATFVGEPTGGGGAVPGDQLRFELPNTGLILRVSSQFFTPPGGERVEKRGVYPDYWITPSIDDMSRGADPVLDYARSLVDRVRN